ncbi:MAG: LptF/LptG family permease [Devosia sp.]|uniref:LptF/LptG family permease n=1 Tax=Devosia sp. TaxID=1871048 RepID=UPI001A5E8327|nr:LptF/LptG family permease [Devosia sp.]MBL8599320.1 LptF/LptG family permease [Devosia sp.]
MTRIDWIILRRLGARIGLVVLVFFGLLCLVESLDTWRFETLNKIGGPLLALAAIVNGAARTSIGTLAVTVLVGTIIGVLDLQVRRELTVIRATGVSIWRVLRMPLIGAVILGCVAAFVIAPLTLNVSRILPVSAARTSGDAIWLEQRGADGPYILQAERARTSGTTLDRVSLFFTDPAARTRVEAEQARLSAGAWELTNAVRYRADSAPESLANVRVPTATTASDMRVRLTSARDLTFGELVNVVSQNVADPALRSSAITSLLRLLALPILLTGSVLIGFAFTSGYRRTNKYGGAVLYGVVLGFVVYVVTELANRSGYAGVLDPAFAAAGPAFVAIVIGLTVLLYKEDGRA